MMGINISFECDNCGKSNSIGFSGVELTDFFQLEPSNYLDSLEYEIWTPPGTIGRDPYNRIFCKDCYIDVMDDEIPDFE